MGTSSKRSRLSKKRSNVPGPSKKASHRQPHKPFDPPIPGALDLPSMRRAEHQARSEYNTHNPFDPDIPLHDVTGQPCSRPRKLVRCPTGGLIRAHVMYPTADEFSKMHSVKPPNRFGRAHNAPPAGGSDVASLVDQLKAEGLDPDDEIMLAHLKQIDMDGQFREHYHNAAEACERAEILHPMHVKLIRYRRTMKEGELSELDYEDLKRELEQRRQEEERIKAEAEAARRAEEERVQAEREARRREEERLCAEEEARVEEERRQEEERKRQQELEEVRILLEQERVRQEAIRKRQQEERWLRDWQEQQAILKEWRLHQEELRRQNEEADRVRRHQSFIQKCEKRQRQEAMREETVRQNRILADLHHRARVYEAQQRRAAVEESIARYRTEAIASYEKVWKALAARTMPDGSLTYNNFPLPVFDNALAPRPDAITPEAVAEFVFSPLRTDAHLMTRRQRIKEECLLWHPDRFEARIIPKVHELDREKVRVAASNIIKILTVMRTQEV